MSSLMPFTPFYGQTVSISASTSSASATVSNTTANQLVITNASTALAFIRTGSGVVTALTSDLPVLPGAAIVISRKQEDTVIAAITASGTTTIYVTPGYGE